MTVPFAIGNQEIGGGKPFIFIGGPCVIESEEHALSMAQRLKEVAARAGVPFVFKSSFDKANRTSVRAFRGPGLVEGLRILSRVRKEIGVPVLTDIHEPAQAEPAGRVVDVIQIPAFLSRQTDLLVAAAKTGVPVNVKKGQFLAPSQARHIVEKLQAAGCTKILLTERGATFGYGDLVADMRSLVLMRTLEVPIVFDVTHSLQLPGANGDETGGQRELIPYLLNAACAVGVDAIFMEVHDDPEHAKSDGPSMARLEDLERMLVGAKTLDRLAKTELYA